MAPLWDSYLQEFLKNKFMWEKSLKSGKSTVIDVRSRSEYAGGHVANSINIPVDELDERMSEIKQMTQPIILCCASGGRSGLATIILKKNGIENAINGGPWMQVNYIKNN